MFKEVFKHFKSKTTPPNLTGVYNFNNESLFSDKVIRRSYSNLGQESNFGLMSAKYWQIRELKEHPGFIFIKNPFTNAGQRYWIAKCLSDYSNKPNKLNLDAHGNLEENENWWEICNNDKARGPILLHKLRWSTLGYHHNWDTKVYNESSKSEFPRDLSEMCNYVANILGFENFLAEAAIINYYPTGTSLSGHTDHSEQNLDAPLFSFSFGQSAIFLLGSENKDTKPSAMFIHSGDIVVMSKQSRLCYHAIPCIVPAPIKPWENFEVTSDGFSNNSICDKLLIENSNKDSEFWEPFRNYLNSSRINMNVRQVLKPGETSLGTAE